jgi:HSP20 family protein
MVRGLIPWRTEPSQMMDSLHREVDSLFDRFFTGSGNGGDRWMHVPPVNVAETDERYEVTAELPGMSPDDFTVEIKDNALWISGEKKEEMEDKGKTFHRMERRYGSFRQTVPLTHQVDDDKVQADYKDGVLTVQVPKAETVKPRRVTVK